MRKEIWVTEVAFGFHHWPEALEEVAFLRHPHRHQFHFKAGFTVCDSNRESEFFLKQQELSQALVDLFPHRGLGFQFGWRSCEMIAEELLNVLDADYVEVSEDGENGAIVRRED